MSSTSTSTSTCTLQKDDQKRFVSPVSKKRKVDMMFTNVEKEASDYIFEELKEILKSYSGRLFLLRDNIWIADERVIHDMIFNHILNSNIYYPPIGNKPAKHYTQNVANAKKVLKALFWKIRMDHDDPTLYDKFHTSTKGKLCFNDGVLCLKTKNFMKWNDLSEPVYSTIKIDRNFEEYFNNPDKTNMEVIKTSIFDNLYGDKCNLALKFLSRAIAGHQEDKRWATYLGNRNCGKGVIYELLKVSLGDYVSTFELGNMLCKKKTESFQNIYCSKKLYWLFDLEFVRLAVSQDIPDGNSGLRVNGEMLKKITGCGDTMVARRNYDRFKIDTTFYIMGNSSLNFHGPDCEETKLEFSSVIQFKTQEQIEYMTEQGRDPLEMVRYKVADPTIKEKCRTEEWCNALIYLLLENYTTSVVEMVFLWY